MDGLLLRGFHCRIDVGDILVVLKEGGELVEGGALLGRNVLEIDVRDALEASGDRR